METYKVQETVILNLETLRIQTSRENVFLEPVQWRKQERHQL